MAETRAQVLVVDDDPAFGEMVTDILSDQGYDVARATEPQRGLELLARAHFEAAVIDLVMPGMGGLELADRIRAASPDTQVVILTGLADVESAIAGIHHGVYDYIQKQSIEAGQLGRSVQQAVAKSRLTRENRRLVERLSESNRLLRALQELSTSISEEPHLDRLLDRLVASAKDLCGAAKGRALLFARAHGDVHVIETCVGDGGGAPRGARLHQSEGIASLCAETNEPILVSDPKEHERYSRRSDELPTELPGLLCAPLHHSAVRGALLVAGCRSGEFGTDHRDVLAGLARQAAVAIDNALQHERSVNFFTHTSDMLVSILDGMDVFYEGHSRSVAALADMLTRRLGLSDAERRTIHFAALLHDIGKIRIDQSILSAKDGFTEENRRQMQEHPTLGLEMLKHITVWEDILPIVHAHHERWDGKGYPRGLEGENIPLGARVVAVAEVFDVITRNTPHGPHRTPAQALAELEAFSGTQFDPKMVRLFIAEYRERGDQIKGKG